MASSTEADPGTVSGEPSNGNEASKAKGKGSRGKKRPAHPLEKLLGGEVKNASGDTMSPKKFVTEDGVLGLYFSARWCGPCTVFTPRLKLLYEVLKAKELPFEVVYVSFDYGQQAFEEYLAKMPWWAMDFEDADRKEDLATLYNVVGVPSLVLLDVVSLEVISGQGRDIVHVDPVGDYFPWKEMPDLEALKSALLEAEKKEEERRKKEAEKNMEEIERMEKEAAERAEREEAERLGEQDQGEESP